MASIIGETAAAIAALVRDIKILLEYYVPGFCLIYVYRRFRSSNSSSFSETIQLGACIVFSYLLDILWMSGYKSLIVALAGTVFFAIYKIMSARQYAKKKKKKNIAYSIVFLILFSIVTTKLFWASHNNEYYRVLYKIVSAIIVALDLVLLHDNKQVKAVFSWVNNTALSETIFECSEMELPCDAIIYGEGKRIEGRLLNYDLAADDAWILVDKYKVFDDHGKLLGSWKYEVKYHQLLVPLSEIKCIKVGTNQGEPENYNDKRKEESDLSKNEEL